MFTIIITPKALVTIVLGAVIFSLVIAVLGAIGRW